jgi:hypothetical protein
MGWACVRASGRHDVVLHRIGAPVENLGSQRHRVFPLTAPLEQRECPTALGVMIGLLILRRTKKR